MEKGKGWRLTFGVSLLNWLRRLCQYTRCNIIMCAFILKINKLMSEKVHVDSTGLPPNPDHNIRSDHNANFQPCPNATLTLTLGKTNDFTCGELTTTLISRGYISHKSFRMETGINFS